MSKINEKYEALVEKMEFSAMIVGFNSNKVETFNIFHSVKFRRGVLDLLKKKGLTFAEFTEELRKEAMYCFWSKCEYEIIVGPWPARRVRSAELVGNELTVPPYFSIDGKEAVRFSLQNPEVAKANRLEDGKYMLQAVKDNEDEKIDVYRQLLPNMERIAEHVIKVSGYRCKKEPA